MPKSVAMPGLAKLQRAFSKAGPKLIERTGEGLTATAKDLRLSLKGKGAADYSISQVRRTAGTLRVALKKIPHRDLRGMPDLRLEPAASPNEAFYNQFKDRLTVNAGAPASTVDRMQSVLHEVGHRTSFFNRRQAYVSFRKMSQAEMFRVRAELELWRGEISNDYDPYSAYKDREVLGEMFADSYSLYLMNPRKLRQISPRIAAMFEENDNA